VVAATNRDLRSDVEKGTFREDFYYRLAAYEVHLPPLRKRSSDIPVLVEHFRRQHTKRLGLRDIAPSTEVLEALERHPWPGNVRELEHLVQRALVDAGSLTDRRQVFSLLERATTSTASPEIGPGIGDDLTLEEIERMHIQAVLQRCGGNRTRTAEVLGIERKSLYRKAERLGIALDALRDM
jgi:DNA-binding NtrC family response regulator